MAEREFTCREAYRGCMPSFVFSIAGQVGFRAALDHLLACRKRDCSSLRKKVREGMHLKLQWLFTEDALLGCVHIQPFLYRTNKIVNLKLPQNFATIAYHLAHCPHESCARLRRALLLRVRDNVSPAALSHHRL